MITTRLAVLLLALALPPAVALPASESPIVLVDVFPDEMFERPVFAKQAPDGTNRMFVGEQAGLVYILPLPVKPGASAQRSVFLDISEKVSRMGNEEGLLGLAFHPDFAKNGRFYLHYSARYRKRGERRNVLASFQVDEKNPQRAVPTSEVEILSVPQPYSNHNGGWIDFRADGMLYVALGDGGSANDPKKHGQNLGTLLGAILRIDVDRKQGGRNYAIPPDNPFVKREGARGEIWAYGLRNPWRCTFDPVTKTMWTGDVGQNKWEEIDIIRKGGNYGWNLREGRADFRKRKRRNNDPLIEPVAVYGREKGISVIGGHVYRGKRIPALVGKYLYADYSTGRIWAIDAAKPKNPEMVLHSRESIASFGRDRAGEIYVCTFGGQILRVDPN
ncbi:MAG: PQQ-dependent sugar dehydrogenase [Planctomycetota bacterium]|jgi:glucose/arabinose dehydrogenase